jgi:hypothetical protein
MIKRIGCILIFAYYLNAYSEPLSWQTFSFGKINWICSSSGIYVFSTDSRSVYPLILDQTRATGTISDIVKNENYLIVSTEAGIYQIDMTSQSIERIPFPGEKKLTGKIASDMDYIWFTSGDSLYRFDKLGREWLSYSLYHKSRILGLQSIGENVDCFTVNSIERFSIGTEKWKTYVSGSNFSDSIRSVCGMQSYSLVQNNNIYMYKSNSEMWEHIELNTQIKDILPDDTILYVNDGSRIFTISGGISRPLDIPLQGKINALGKTSDTLIMALEDRIMKYNLKKSDVTFVEYPSQLNSAEIEKIIGNSSFITIISSSDIFLYDGEAKRWTAFSRNKNRKSAKFSWNNEGPLFQYKDGLSTSLKGNVQSFTSFKSAGYVKDTVHGIIDSTLLVKWIQPNVIADVSLHSVDLKNRTFDLLFDNSNRSISAKKVATYRGASEDHLNFLKAGTCQSDLFQSQLLPQVQFEGGQLGIDSKKKLDDRDRKIVRVNGGAGLITTRTVWKILPYRADGIYKLKASSNSSDTLDLLGNDSTDLSDSLLPDIKDLNDTIQIVPGSASVWVDGELLDSTTYTFISETGKLRFRRTAPIDPVSLITVSYKVQTIPDAGLERVEFKPENNFGKIGYGTLTVSPFQWISTRVGFEGTSVENKLQPVWDMSVPLEYRKSGSDIFLKLTPEFSYNQDNNSDAGGLSLQSRIGKSLAVTFDGRYYDSSFSTTDTVSHGYGKVKDEYNADISYDILPELPLSYSQHRYVAMDGIETNYRAGFGAHFTGLPYFDINATRTILDQAGSDSLNAFDSIFHIKDKISFHLYETSSLIMQRLLRSKKLSYDLLFTEYRYQDFNSTDFNNGMRTDAEVIYMPIQAVALKSNTIYRNGERGEGLSSTLEPSFEIQTIDAPRGVDLNGEYRINFARFYSKDFCTDTISRRINIKLNPGKWWTPLRYFSPIGGFTQYINSNIPSGDPASNIMITGKSGDFIQTKVYNGGLNIFPSDAILLKNNNRWTRGDSIKSFASDNVFQWWFDSRHSLLLNGAYTTDYTNSSATCNAAYDFAVTSWFRLLPELNGANTVDSTGHTFAAGPRLTMYITFLKYGILKNFLNTQKIAIDWKRENGVVNKNIDFAYTFTLRFTLLPEIQFLNQDMLQFTEGKFNSFNSKLMLNIVF